MSRAPAPRTAPIASKRDDASAPSASRLMYIVSPPMIPLPQASSPASVRPTQAALSAWPTKRRSPWRRQPHIDDHPRIAPCPRTSRTLAGPNRSSSRRMRSAVASLPALHQTAAIKCAQYQVSGVLRFFEMPSLKRPPLWPSVRSRTEPRCSSLGARYVRASSENEDEDAGAAALAAGSLPVETTGAGGRGRRSCIWKCFPEERPRETYTAPSNPATPRLQEMFQPKGLVVR